MGGKQRRVALQCPACKEEHIMMVVGEEFDPGDQCDACGHKGSLVVLEDDGESFAKAQCIYCDTIISASGDFDPSAKCPKCGKSGAYVVLDEDD